MKISYSILFALQALSVAAAPTKKVGTAESVSSAVATVSNAAGAAATSAAATAPPGKAAPPGTAVGGAEEKDENEIEQAGQFGTAVNIGAGVKTDTLYPKGKVGGFEVEINTAQARQLRVTENKTPGAAPPGFTNIEGVSFKVEIGGGSSKGFTLAKIDYIGDEAGAPLSAGQIGRLCNETNSFVIGAGVGDLEFETDENELTMTVADLVGEWAIFLPVAAGGAAGGATGGTTGGAAGNATTGIGAGAGNATPGTGAGAGSAAKLTGCETGTVCRNILDLILGATAPK